MKAKVTKKEIMNNYSTVVEIGYCELQSISYYFSPQYYTCGIYGWNADVYIIDGVAFVTGYRPFGTCIPTRKEIARVNFACDKLRSKNLPYEKEAKKVIEILLSLIK